MKKKLTKLIKKYEHLGFYKGADLLLVPEIGINFLDELERLDIDWGLTGVHVYSKDLYGDYVEGAGYLTLDAIPRDKDFVSESIHQARIFLSERLDPHETHISLKLESEGLRKRRQENL